MEAVEAVIQNKIFAYLLVINRDTEKLQEKLNLPLSLHNRYCPVLYVGYVKLLLFILYQSCSLCWSCSLCRVCIIITVYIIPVPFFMSGMYKHYCLYYTSPVLYGRNNSKIVIYGEINKFVPMSQQRIFKFWNDANSLAVTIRGFPNENATFVYSVDGMIKTTYNIIDQKTQCATVTLFGKPNIPSGLDCTYTQPTPKSRPKHKPFEKIDYSIGLRYDIGSPDGFIIKF
ncbi:hypothetical protein LOTGIDRAFT_176442 [Lottia gigantea]|uniref:Uncharacterized protein n=1 Tax=Lottia gigantea TaxID=225164 RepID=V4AW37_LOTGI|nr:hypothetical protein LOTGIDRAFT_176442 [Lottia gigantea]ESP01643.1 hypothetical protein LOTGIDRAFT_176442 [Lottia gigantea]